MRASSTRHGIESEITNSVYREMANFAGTDGSVFKNRLKASLAGSLRTDGVVTLIMPPKLGPERDLQGVAIVPCRIACHGTS